MNKNTLRSKLLHGAMVVFVFAGVTILAAPSYVQAGSFPGTNGLIAFTTYRTGNNEIYTMRDDGTNPVNLTNHPGQDSAPSWSPDGRMIAFQSDRAGGKTEIYRMNADGSGVKRLTANDFRDSSPSWSPDGNYIAFERTLADGNSEIYTMRVDGTEEVNLTRTPEADHFPSWSPDGKKILFTSHRGGAFNEDVYIMNPDGSGQTIVFDGAGETSRASWSPDGAKIIFKGDFERSNELLIGTASGGILKQLTYDFNNDNVAPTGAWSPDGKKITFYTSLNCNVEICPNPGDYSSEVYTQDLSDVDSRRNISNNPSLDIEPAWQPIPIPIRITTTELPHARAHEMYSFAIHTTGGAGTKTFSVSQEELPKGLTLDSARGVIGGTPKRHGAFTFSIQVSDLSGTDTRAFTLVVEKQKPLHTPNTINTHVNVGVKGDNNIVDLAISQ